MICPDCGAKVPDDAKCCTNPTCGIVFSSDDTIRGRKRPEISSQYFSKENDNKKPMIVIGERKCPSCGKLVSDSDKYCTECGKPLTSIPDYSNEKNNKEKTDTDVKYRGSSQSPNSTKRSVIIALIITALVIAYLYYAVNKPSPSSYNSSGSSTIACGVCGKTYRAGDSTGNYKSIMLTHMCKKCYANFQAAHEMYQFAQDNK